MAKSKTKPKSKSKKKSATKAKAKQKGSARTSAKGSKSKSKSVKKASTSKKNASRRKSAASSATESVFKRVFDRVKPIFQQPLDPRIKHLVEVFGTEAVVGLMEAYRQSRDAAHHDELREAMAQAEAPEPQPAPEPPKHGTWVWHELMTHDTGSAKRFYREMFGWESNDMEMMPGFNYTTFTKGGEHMGGMQTIRPEQGSMPSGWGVYIAVDDVDSAADMAEDLGGEIIVPAHDIPVGRWAMVKDPAGATLCLYRMKM